MSLTYRYLSIPFRNPFDNRRVSHEDFIQFAREVQGSLRVNREMLGIPQVQADNFYELVAQYQSSKSNQYIAASDRKSATVNLEDVYALFVDEVRRKEALVRSKFSVKSREYLSIFPQRLKPYQQTPKGDQGTLIMQVKTSFGWFETDFPGVADTFAALESAYNEALEGQVNNMGTVKRMRSMRDVAREVLAGNLHELWLTAALYNRGKPEVVKILFNVSVFNKGTRSATDKRGRLILEVRDAGGMPVVDAAVEVRTLENQIVQKGRTKTDGRYKGRLMAIGFYHVVVKQPGLTPYQGRYQVFDNQDPVREVVMERG